jgi:hypothetical protein
MFAGCPAQRIATDCEIRIDYRFDLVDLGESLGPVVECVHDSMVLVHPVPRGFRNGDLFGLLTRLAPWWGRMA